MELYMYGLKCDNPNCDWKDDNIQAKEYPQWVGKPCPKCGQNVLTEADYKCIKFLQKISQSKIINALNNLLIAAGSKEKTYTMKMNGTGIINIQEAPDQQ